MVTIQGVTRILNVSLTRSAGVRGLASFNIPAVISDDVPNATFGASNRAKKYTISEVSAGAVDTDFGSSTATAKAANAMISQSPTVQSIYVIKTDTNVAQEKTVTWSGDFTSGDVISGILNGDSFSITFTTDQTTTQGLLNAALAGAYGMDTSAGAANVNTLTSDAGYQVDLSISATGGSAPTATIATSTEGRTIAADITDALNEVSTALWYGLYYCGTNEGSMWEATVKAESAELLFGFQSNVSTLKDNSTTDILSRIKAAGYTRSFGTYRGTLTDHLVAGEFARCLAADPGSITFWGKTIAGSTPDNLTSSEIGFIEGKSGNNYAYIAGQGNFQPGVCANGDSIQTTRDLDYFKYKLVEKLLNVLVSRDKTPYNRTGLAIVQTNGQSVMDQMVNENIFDSGVSEGIDAPIFTTPDIDDVDAADKTAHLLDGCTYNATYLDGIRRINVTGNIQIGGA